MKNIALVILAACSGTPATEPTPSPSAPALPASKIHAFVSPAPGTTCNVPDAVANDGIDDTLAVSAALTSCGCLQLGDGAYNFDIGARPRNATHINTLTLGDYQCIRGVGPGTVLKFTGDAQAYDWIGIALTGTASGGGGLVADLTIDTTGLSNVQEQTHAIQVYGPINRAQVRNVTFLHAPVAGTSTGGDCIKLYGFSSTGKPVNDTQLVGNLYARCPRSAVSLRGVHGLLVGHSQFIGVGKVDVDTEEAGGDADGIVLDGDVFLNGAGDSELAISIAGTSHTSISGTVVIGKGVYIAGASQVTMAGDVVLKTAHPISGGGGMASVRVFGRSADVAISGSYLGRGANTIAAPVFETMADDQGTDPTAITYASHVTVIGSRLKQFTTAVAARIESTTDYKFVANDVDCAGCTIGIDVQGVAHRADRGLIALNAITGATVAEVRLTGVRLGVGRTSVIGNVGEGATQGLRCENVAAATGVAGITGPIVTGGTNNWPINAAACVLTAGN